MKTLLESMRGSSSRALTVLEIRDEVLGRHLYVEIHDQYGIMGNINVSRAELLDALGITEDKENGE